MYLIGYVLDDEPFINKQKSGEKIKTFLALHLQNPMLLQVAEIPGYPAGESFWADGYFAEREGCVIAPAGQWHESSGVEHGRIKRDSNKAGKNAA